MPVTKTAKRALRGSTTKQLINDRARRGLEIAMRQAKKKATAANVVKATSLADRLAKRNVIHKNKASRIKSALSKLLKK